MFTTLEGGFPWTSRHGSAQIMYQSTANRIVLVSILSTFPFRGNLDGIHPISRYTSYTNILQNLHIFYTPFTPLKSTFHTFLHFFGASFHFCRQKTPVEQKIHDKKSSPRSPHCTRSIWRSVSRSPFRVGWFFRW